MANVKLIFLFSLVIAIGLSSGFELGKNRKQKSAVKQKLGSMIVKAKSAKQFKELKRQNNLFPWDHGPSIHDGFELGKNQKEKSALKKLESMIVKAKSAKQFKEPKRQDEPSIPGAGMHFPSIHDGDYKRNARNIPPLA